MEGGEKRLDGYFSEDRISALPDSLVDCILDCLSLHDVVRTSVLSTRWRHCWTRVRKLFFDQDFFEKYVETGNLAVGSVIESILSRLDGPIHEFCLDIDMDETRKVSQHVMGTSHGLRLDVSRWIPLLLEGGIRDLFFQVLPSFCVCIPSHILNCPTLTDLTIFFCEFGPSHGFVGFSNLVYLHLGATHISASLLENVITNSPHLKYLDLEHLFIDDDDDDEEEEEEDDVDDNYADEDVDDDYADDDKPLVIHALQLESLLIYSVHRPFYLNKCPSLTLAYLLTKLEVPMVDRLQTTKLDSFVLGMPKVETLVLHGTALTSLAVGGVPTTLTTRFQNLKDLDLYHIDVLSPAQLSSAFCIIRISPNLQSLKIFMTDEPSVDRDKNAAIRFYHALEDDLSRLSKVEFNKLLGTKYEVMFIKTFLCCCPVIESVSFRSHEDIKLDSEIRMMTKSWANWLPESANIYFKAQWQEETKHLFDH